MSPANCAEISTGRAGKQAESGPPVEGEAIVPNSPLAWGPQPYKGNIFVTDMNSGLWVVKHERAEELNP